jgi:hypothetical protein
MSEMRDRLIRIDDCLVSPFPSVMSTEAERIKRIVLASYSQGAGDMLDDIVSWLRAKEYESEAEAVEKTFAVSVSAKR